MTAVTILAHMGTSHSKACNKLAHCVWNWCVDNNVWLSTAHIPGKMNVMADWHSRNVNNGTEWALNPKNIQGCIK